MVASSRSSLASWWCFSGSKSCERSSQQLLNPRAFENASLTTSGTLKGMADNQRRSSDRIRSRLISRVSSKPLTTPRNSDASEHQEPPRKRSRIPEKTGTHLESRSQPSKIAESGLDPSQIFTPYQYEPLNEVAQETRLLTILPGSFSSEIRVCLDIKSFATEDPSGKQIRTSSLEKIRIPTMRRFQFSRLNICRILGVPTRSC